MNSIWNTRLCATAVALVALLAIACDTDELLEVPDPDIVAGPVFNDPTNLPAVYRGAVAEFARAVAGTPNNDGGIILYGGLLADEFYNSDNFNTRQQVDRRQVDITNAAVQNAYFWLHRARNHAEVAAELFAASEEDAGTPEHAELLALAGFTYLLFGEHFCSGVPFSRLPQEGPTEYGSSLTTQQIFERAIERFDAAVALSSGSDQVETLARLGKARALLNLDQPADAAALAAAIPTSFQHIVNYSDAVFVAGNAVWQLTNAEKRWSISGAEGENGLPFHDGDPRTPAERTGGSFVPEIPHFSQFKYNDSGSDIPLTSGVEARLIEAEAALRTGNRTQFFSIHNAVRATVDLADLQDTGQSAAALTTLHFAERARWLWLTGHRVGDLRRLIRQYDRTQAQVFPIGPTERGEDRGTDVALPVPFAEQNNPNYEASACVPSAA
jgi:hypothetical protein